MIRYISPVIWRKNCSTIPLHSAKVHADKMSRFVSNNADMASRTVLMGCVTSSTAWKGCPDAKGKMSTLMFNSPSSVSKILNISFRYLGHFNFAPYSVRKYITGWFDDTCRPFWAFRSHFGRLKNRNRLLAKLSLIWVFRLVLSLYLQRISVIDILRSSTLYYIFINEKSVKI